jgi:hypothetical protein
VEVADGLADFHFGALRNEDFKGAIGFGEDFRSNFIGFDFEKGIAGGDRFAIFPFPSAEST